MLEDVLRRVGDCSGTSHPFDEEQIVTFYDNVDVHRRLVGDEVRTSAFRNSIAATVRPGTTVLDVGAGSGILSLFAAQAGARRVYAVERAPQAARLARRLVEANGFSQIITIVEGAAESVRLPEPVDVLVSEWLGAYGVDENMLAPVLLARDRWLESNGQMIPASCTAWCVPVDHDAGRDATRFHTRPYGLNLSSLAPYPLDDAVWLPHGVNVADLRAEPLPLWTTDCRTTPAEAATRPYAAEATFHLTGDGVTGLVTWFVAEMPGAEPLSNGPGQPPTHWGQFLFPLVSGCRARRGDELHVGFHNVPAGRLGSHHIWAARVGDGPLEVHDTRRRTRPLGVPPWRIFQPPAREHSQGGFDVRQADAP